MQTIETMEQFENLPVEQQDIIYRLIRNLMIINGLTKTLTDAGPGISIQPVLMNVMSSLTLSEMVVEQCHANLTADPSHELIILLMASQAKALM
jgi:hypothetical protein